MLEIIPIPAFEDNYIWVIRKGEHIAVVDPGDASPVIDYIEKEHLSLSAILITHHHADHIGGVKNLFASYQPAIYAPSYEQYDFPHTPLKAKDHLYLNKLDVSLEVLHLPGHTLGHIAYVNDQVLFCGDTLFGAGCGRLFEGMPEQMLESLNTLKKLPPDTLVFCTHEYTLKNIDFALTLDPHNQALLHRQTQCTLLRSKGLPTIPSTIGAELATNPFLRCTEPIIIQSLQLEHNDEISVFTKIRQLRNYY